jgi:hypothetical protein
MTTSMDRLAERLAERHARCLDALPAFVGGTLEPNATAAVLAHTGECAPCREELTFAWRVQRHFAREWYNVAPLLEPEREEAAFDQLWSRIAAEEPAPANNRRRGWRAVVPLALAASAIFAVGLPWYQNATVPDYRTLADSPPRSCGQVRVQVDPRQPPADTVRRLESAGTRVVDGPSAEGVYTLSAANPTDSLSRLRALPEVRLAEPTRC